MTVLNEMGIFRKPPETDQSFVIWLKINILLKCFGKKKNKTKTKRVFLKIINFIIQM